MDNSIELSYIRRHYFVLQCYQAVIDVVWLLLNGFEQLSEILGEYFWLCLQFRSEVRNFIICLFEFGSYFINIFSDILTINLWKSYYQFSLKAFLDRTFDKIVVIINHIFEYSFHESIFIWFLFFLENYINILFSHSILNLKLYLSYIRLA
jgi:hypothetical protein